MADSQSANQTGVVPDERVSWVKNPLITQIRFHDAVVDRDYIEIRYYTTYINSSNAEVKTTGKPTPDGPAMRLYFEGKEIPPAPSKGGDIEPYKAAPRDEDIRRSTYVMKPNEKWVGEVADEFVIMNTQFLPGTHIYEMVYWQTQLDWIDVREVLQRTDSRGKNHMMYPITDNAPSNRLYFKVYKPTDDEVRQGRHIEFLGEVDARTQIVAMPYTRPGDFAPKTGYWSATGASIERLGGYHEVFVKEGDSMPNLPGDQGVDPFSFQWKYMGERSQAGNR
ncbi:hypothetical protein [Paraburkholderia strydomiana]|uniref:hypothetical protein n=1 Tax=Paraburkholderia strydomiana TaxID=1245417 RepID=UPI00203647DF|nr:hypothetical protein [Paraburkholderia strydomiana]